MKIKRILLSDLGDTFYTDLIEFKRDTTKKEVQDIITKCINEIEDYTNEDIYKYLEKEIGIENLIFLGNYETFYY